MATNPEDTVGGMWVPLIPTPAPEERMLMVASVDRLMAYLQGLPKHPPAPAYRRLWWRLRLWLSDLRHLACCGRCRDEW